MSFFLKVNSVFSGDSDGKESTCNAGYPGSIPGSGRSPGERNGNPLQHSCLENSTDRGAWWAAVHGVAKSQTRLSNYHFHFHNWISHGKSLLHHPCPMDKMTSLLWTQVYFLYWWIFFSNPVFFHSEQCLSEFFFLYMWYYQLKYCKVLCHWTSLSFNIMCWTNQTKKL